MNVRGRAVAAALGIAATLSGCQSIPQDASTQEFCRAGERYSALRDVSFAKAVEVSRQLAEVGTPAGIDASARAGFVELVERMEAASSAEDFRNRTTLMSATERQHLLDLDEYIQQTCVETTN